MSTRHFGFWCERCPTRVSIETEVPSVAADDEPQYAFADAVGLVQARPSTPDDDGLEPAMLCPACGGQLCDLDDLLPRGEVPYHEDKDSASVHAAWLAKLKERP